jgi:small-conductance mechanosensitive channel
MAKKIFNNERETLMFYHTTLRNIIGLTTLAFVSLTFSKNLKTKINDIILKLLAFIFSLMALYFNYSLIQAFSNSDKDYKFVNNYLTVNYGIFAILVVLKIFIIYKLFVIFIKR